MRIFKAKSLKALLTIAVIGIFMILHSGVANADTDTAIDGHGPETNSGTIGSTNFTPVTGVGQGAFDGTYSWYKVYIPKGQSVTVTVNQICADLGSPSVKYTLLSLDDTEKYASALGNFGNIYETTKPGGSCSNDVSWSVGSSAGIPSTIRGHEGYRVFAIIAKINPAPGDNERYFKVGASSGVKIGLSTPDFTSTGYGYDLKYSTAYKQSAGQWDYEVMFAPRCNANDSNPTIKIYDPDNGIYQSNMHAYLEESSRSGPLNWSTKKNWSAAQVQGGAWGTSGTTSDDLTFSADSDHIYKFHIVGSAYPNTIQVKLPFDQFDASLSSGDCQNFTLDGKSRVDDTTLDVGDHTTFHHTVWNKDASTGNATYDWQVQRKYINKDGSTNGWVDGNLPSGHCPTGSSGVAPGNHCPTLDLDYSFPNGAQTGDKYCQRITYDGGDTGDDNACVTYQNASANTYSCKKAVVEMGDSDSVKLTFEGTNIDGQYTITNNHTYNYYPTGLGSPFPTGSIKITVDRYKNGHLDGEVVHNRVCYHAKCSLDSVVGDPSDHGLVVAGGQYIINLSITNDVDDYDTEGYGLNLPNTILGKNIAVAENGVVHNLNTGINKGETVHVPIHMTAPATFPSPNPMTITFAPIYNGLMFLNGSGAGSCDIPVSVYEHFHIQPVPTFKDTDPENPTTVTYTGAGTLTEGPTTHAAQTTTLSSDVACASVAGNPATTIGHDYGDNSGSPDTYHCKPSSITAGNQYCANVSIYVGDGYAGPGGPLYPQTVTGSTCIKVHDEPYVQAFGGDVYAGGGFAGGTCTSAGGIDTYMDPSQGNVHPAGSGVQIGALSIGPINGFSSANLRGSDPTGYTGLSFSNTENTSSVTSDNAAMGGKLGGSHCASDYFSLLMGKDGNPTVPKNIATTSMSLTGQHDVQYFDPGGTGTGTLKITGGAIANGQRLAIFVKGNVHITNNITFTGAAGSPANNPVYGSPDNIPSLYIIVEGGSIYVDPGVTRLDGVYTAQPSGGAGGTIYTCESGTPLLAADSLYGSCDQQLVVNGAFVAQNVVFDRSHGSLRYSQGGETMSGAAHNCGKDTKADCAGEVFNFTPEVYLGQPAFKPKSGPTSNVFQSITSLSPVL